MNKEQKDLLKNLKWSISLAKSEIKAWQKFLKDMEKLLKNYE